MASAFKPSALSNPSRARMNPWGNEKMKDINNAEYVVGTAYPDAYDVKIVSNTYGNKDRVFKYNTPEWKAVVTNLVHNSGAANSYNRGVLSKYPNDGLNAILAAAPTQAPSAPPASSPSAQTTIAPVVTPTEEPPEEEKFYQKDWFMPVAIGLGIALIGGTAAFFIARSGKSSAPAMA